MGRYTFHRRQQWSVVTGALAAVVASAAWGVQPPADAPNAAQPQAASPAKLCLTNACGGGVDPTGQTKARTVAEAIKLGNAQQVRELGGTIAQVAEASAERFAFRIANATPATLEGQKTVANNFARFFDTSNGATLEWSDDTSGQIMLAGTNRTVTGSIVRRGDPDGRVKQIWMTSDGGLMGQLPPGQVPIGGGLAVIPPPGYNGPVSGIPVPISPQQAPNFNLPRQ